jgi:hypothetical protein
MVERDEVNAQRIAVIGILGALVAFAIMVGVLVVYYDAMAAQFRDKELTEPNRELESLRAEQREKLGQCAWVDRPKQVVAIPIDRAMDVVVRDVQAGRGLPPAIDVKPAGKEVKNGKS